MVYPTEYRSASWLLSVSGEANPREVQGDKAAFRPLMSAHRPISDVRTVLAIS